MIWIYGGAGLGKSYLSKHMARKYLDDKGYIHDTYFVDSSGKDKFQNYIDEKVIILDDLKPDSISRDTLLALLDPFSNRELSSRYFDKDITFVEMVIICSPINPIDFIRKMKDFDSTQESYEQFLRRFDVVINPCDTNFVNFEKGTTSKTFKYLVRVNKGLSKKKYNFLGYETNFHFSASKTEEIASPNVQIRKDDYDITRLFE